MMLATDPCAALAADLFVPAGATVLDLGRPVPAPAQVSWNTAPLAERARLLESGALPAAGGATLLTAVGLLEHAADVPALLARLRSYDLPLVVGYAASDLDPRNPASHLSGGALAEALARAGFAISVAERAADGAMLVRATPRRDTPVRSPRVVVASFNNLSNFGDRLGYHLMQEVLPAGAEVVQVHFNPYTPPEGDFDLLVLGIGNSLFQPLLDDALIALLDRAPHAVGIFGTQYREGLDPRRLGAFLDRLDVWFARYEDDVHLYGRGRDNVVHLGDWLVNAFPMTRPTVDEPLMVDDWVWEDVSLDRTIQRIQRHRRVVSERLHPLLCAFTSAEEVAYIEQHDPEGRPSGKFRSLLMDVFGRSFAEDRFFPVDREAVVAYKTRVRAMTDELRRVLGLLLA